MGVAGLWPKLYDAGEPVNLVELGLAGFLRKHIRGYKVGVDVSIWLYHVRAMDADVEKFGIHAGARTLMYRILTYIRRGFLLYFVFDGPSRPDHKRGKVRFPLQRRGGGVLINRRVVHRWRNFIS
jgi:Holliday junction resolvase YEN1